MLKTEMRNPNTTHIDKMSTLEMMAAIQQENLNAAQAVGKELDAVARVVDAVSLRMSRGGRLYYVGCGTSGRLGVMDAAECPPTYGVPADLVVGVIAGGDSSLRRASEGAEDGKEAGFAALQPYNITENDSVLGISVAGGAAYVLGALEYAKSKGALTISLSSNPGCPMEQLADLAICPDTGAEVITGSTRMKAGSAHKMVLNMISTGVMIRQGHVYENLMINLKPTNIKLRARVIRIVCQITGLEEADALRLLDASGWVIRDALALWKQEG